MCITEGNFKLNNSVYSSLTASEKISISISSLVFAIFAFINGLRLKLAPSYNDFIVGNVAWNEGSKFQDLISVPIFIFVLFSVYVLLAHQISKAKDKYGIVYVEKLSNQIMWWSIPCFAAVSKVMLGGEVDDNVIGISVMGLIFILSPLIFNKISKYNADSDTIGFAILSIFLISFLPLEIAMVLSRAPIQYIGDIQTALFLKAQYLILLIGFFFGLYFVLVNPKKLGKLIPKLLLVGQIAMPTLFLTFYPARLLQSNGQLTKYVSGLSLKLLLVSMIIWGIYDVVKRYQKFSSTTNLSKVISPVAIFAFLILLKMGNTNAPVINPDDYHFGESLLGWWSYLHGFLPYVDYIPAHGIVDDDLNGFMSTIFYDGSAGSIAETSRLSFAVLAFFAFISIYYFSGSIGVAFICIFFISGRLSWLFFTPFLCLWFSKSLRSDSSNWLVVWFISAPLVILGVPPQGLLLVAASGVMAAFYFFVQFKTGKIRSWTKVSLTIVILLILFKLTPLGSMFFAAIRYVLENGPINQTAYGIPWSLSWTGSGIKYGFFFEALRMSWVIFCLICLFIIYNNKKKLNNSTIYPVIVILLFTLLLIPYSMGRIDPGNISRQGLIGMFCWAILLPIISCIEIKENYKMMLILLSVCMSSVISYEGLSSFRIYSSVSQNINVPLFRDVKSFGLDNIGNAYVQDDHWDRLVSLDKILKSRLSPADTYLDLTSRNAHYFYFNRLPPVAVTAPYNMVSLKQQMRAVEQISKNPPKVALLEDQNIVFDGGGLALRNPYLYRFIVDQYSPKYEEGFIFGYLKTDLNNYDDTKIDFKVKDVTDINWDHGYHRSESAIILDDPLLVSFIKIGDQINLGLNGMRKVTRVWQEGYAVWFEGLPILYSEDHNSLSNHIIMSHEDHLDYISSLFKKSFSINNLQRIPSSWGKSEKTLNNKMKLIKKLDGKEIDLHDISLENNLYKVIQNDPYISFNLTDLNISGRDAGLLRFEFSCLKKLQEPKLQVFWWGDKHNGAFEQASVRFDADNGEMIVPVDSSPFWILLDKIKGVRIDLDNASACSAFTIKNVALYQRLF